MSDEIGTTMKFLKIAPVALLLGACSIFGGGGGDEIVFDTTLGPRTEDQIKQLGTGLKSDSDNINYTGDQKKGDKLESEDGSGLSAQ